MISLLESAVISVLSRLKRASEADLLRELRKTCLKEVTQTELRAVLLKLELMDLVVVYRGRNDALVAELTRHGELSFEPGF